MAFDISAIRHPKEKLYGALTLCSGAAIWGAVVLGVLLAPSALALVAVLGGYALLIWLLVTVVRALMRAYMFGHYVLVGPDQFPHIHLMVEEGSKQLGLKEIPLTFVYNSHGVMNAFALRLLGKSRYVWITSALIDADNEEQLRFVIGHELGHHAAGHLDHWINLARLPGLMVPFLGAAYSRSRELTCDRVGAYITRDLTVARTALQMLACGSAKLNSQMNGAVFALQDKMVPPIAGFVLKVFSTYPRLTRRVEEVSQWLQAQGPAQSPLAKAPASQAAA